MCIIYYNISYERKPRQYANTYTDNILLVRRYTINYQRRFTIFRWYSIVDEISKLQSTVNTPTNSTSRYNIIIGTYRENVVSKCKLWSMTNIIRVLINTSKILYWRRLETVCVPISESNCIIINKPWIRTLGATEL